ITTILVTHDQEEALTMADKIVVMNNAVVEQIGTPKEIYNSPKTAFTANFIGTMNLYQQDRTAWGVRPELIGITRTAKAGDPAYLKGTIEEIEFRGALTRIYGRLEESGETVCADMDSHQEETLCLKEKEEVFFHIPQSGIIRYPGQKGAERNTA
ncbi:MAG TPA: TOBE domain-containing protein, partial [Candidatus Blautia merdipullorum]|nr:TOBE domain-containing protein [Candidatus Blautia merdipullorum]